MSSFREKFLQSRANYVRKRSLQVRNLRKADLRPSGRFLKRSTRRPPFIVPQGALSTQGNVRNNALAKQRILNSNPLVVSSRTTLSGGYDQSSMRRITDNRWSKQYPFQFTIPGEYGSVWGKNRHERAKFLLGLPGTTIPPGVNKIKSQPRGRKSSGNFISLSQRNQWKYGPYQVHVDYYGNGGEPSSCTCQDFINHTGYGKPTWACKHIRACIMQSYRSHTKEGTFSPETTRIIQENLERDRQLRLRQQYDVIQIGTPSRRQVRTEQSWDTRNKIALNKARIATRVLGDNPSAEALIAFNQGTYFEGEGIDPVLPIIGPGGAGGSNTYGIRANDTDTDLQTPMDLDEQLALQATLEDELDYNGPDRRILPHPWREQDTHQYEDILAYDPPEERSREEEEFASLGGRSLQERSPGKERLSNINPLWNEVSATIGPASLIAGSSPAPISGGEKETSIPTQVDIIDVTSPSQSVRPHPGVITDRIIRVECYKWFGQGNLFDILIPVNESSQLPEVETNIQRTTASNMEQQHLMELYRKYLSEKGRYRRKYNTNSGFMKWLTRHGYHQSLTAFIHGVPHLHK